MRRIRAMLALVVSMSPVPALADDVVMRDGSMQPVAETALTTISSSTWPGWVALCRNVPIREDDVASSMLCLDDGQRLGGAFNVVQDALWWRSRAIGAVRVDLERVSWIGPPTLASQPVPSKDSVALVNGDRVEGFVNAVQAERGVEVETGTGSASPTRTWYELDKVASIQLSPRPRAATGWRLWLRDGSVVDVDAWTREGSRVSLQGLHLPGAAPRVMVAWDEVIGVVRASLMVVPLATRPWQASDAPDTPRLAPATVVPEGGVRMLDLRAIEMHGPGTFQARIPDGKWMLDATITHPPALIGRVACDVQVLMAGKRILRTRLDSTTRSAVLHAPVEGGDLQVLVSESARGAFGASVRLEGGMLTPLTADEAAPTPTQTSAPAPAPAPTDPR